MEKSLSMTEFQHNWVWNTALTNSTVMAIIYFFACVLCLSHKKSWQTKIIHNRMRGAGVFDQWEDFYNSMWAVYSKHICKLVKDEKISSVLVSQNGLIITICLCLCLCFFLHWSWLWKSEQTIFIDWCILFDWVQKSQMLNIHETWIFMPRYLRTNCNIQGLKMKPSNTTVPPMATWG